MPEFFGVVVIGGVITLILVMACGMFGLNDDGRDD